MSQKYIWSAIAILSLLVAVVTSAGAQELYRPMLMKSDKIADTGGLCIRSEQIAAAAKVFGIPWVADVSVMTLLPTGGKVEIAFEKDCAVAARLVR
jgi:hypothetical protein